MDDDSFSKKANISVISRFDHEVKDIVISASQVALYVFDARKSKWIKRKVEGACFFYKRKTSPKYGIFILNRLDTTNFIELMNSTMEIQLQEPYILYRNIFKTIYGIWFYERSDCSAMALVFHHILTELKEKEKEEQDNDVDISKDKSYSEISDVNDRECNETPNRQPDSVRIFFAKASKEVSKPQTVLRPSCSKSLCGSFKSVTHIETAQKSDTLENSYLSADAFDIVNNLRNDIISPTQKSDVLRVEKHGARVNAIENSIGNLKLPLTNEKLNIFSPKENVNVSSSEFPELIPPRMLLTADLSSSVKTKPLDIEKNLRVSPLTKSQMIQAMEYLLKSDSQFINKLYDAYLKSARS